MRISGMKVFRARNEEIKLMRGYYASRYTLLRDYVLELQTCTPDTTMNVDVEKEPNFNSETRAFRRIYICLGPLKRDLFLGRGYCLVLMMRL